MNMSYNEEINSTHGMQRKSNDKFYINSKLETADTQ